MVDRPWKIRKEGGPNLDCQRLGCKSNVRKAISSPHSGLMILACPPCYDAHEKWVELMMNGKSKINEIHVGNIHNIRS